MRFHYDTRGAVLSARISVVTFSVPDFAAKHPITPHSADQDDRNDEKRADERKAETLRRAGGIQLDVEAGMTFGHKLMPKPL